MNGLLYSLNELVHFVAIDKRGFRNSSTNDILDDCGDIRKIQYGSQMPVENQFEELATLVRSVPMPGFSQTVADPPPLQ